MYHDSPIYIVCFCSHNAQHFDYLCILSLSEPIISVNVASSITTDSLIISWTLTELAEDVTVTQYTISYSNIDCHNYILYNNITGISDSETMFTLTDLEEGTEYSIYVTAILSDGGTASDTVAVTTIAVG